MTTGLVILGSLVVVWGFLFIVDRVRQRREEASLLRFLAERQIHDIKRRTIRQMFEMEKQFGRETVDRLRNDAVSSSSFSSASDLEVIEGEVSE